MSYTFKDLQRDIDELEALFSDTPDSDALGALSAQEYENDH